MNQGPELVIAQILILLFSVVIHEVSHGYAALALGDRTAKYAGRLTLNPFPHLDFLGSIIVPGISLLAGGFLFGWAKPVPYNPYNLSNQKWGPAVVGAAGPIANLAIAFLFGLFIRFAPEIFTTSTLFLNNLFSVASIIVFLNVLLAVFNLVPIPPLDGSKVLFAILPYRFQNIQIFLEQYGFILLLFFIFFLFRFLQPIIFFLFSLFTGTTPF